jgi:uncharacterized phiE125 gp8 family phage protein
MSEFFDHHRKDTLAPSITEIATPPYAEAIDTTEMKNHLKVDTTADDSLIASMTTAARDVVETGTGSNVPRQRTMLATQFTYKVDNWGQLENEQLPRIPVISLDSITYIDTSGNTQTLSTSIYELKGDYIELKRLQVWPSVDAVHFPITVTFKAGIVANFARTSGDTLTVYGRTFTNGDAVQVKNSGGALPTGLSENTTYYVISVSGATFSLSTTAGGSAVTLTGAGTGTNYIGEDLLAFETLRNAMKLIVGAWYRNREAFVLDRQPYALPIAVDHLIGSQHA